MDENGPVNTSPNSSSIHDEFKKQPPSIMKEIWIELKFDSRKELQRIHDDIFPPKGVDEKLWEKCSKEELKSSLLQNSKRYFENSVADSLSLQIVKNACTDFKNSNIARFFSSKIPIDFDVCKKLCCILYILN